MADRQSILKFLRGTAVKITTILDIDTADSALITIDDPSNTEKVTDANMTKETDKVYSYTWQSAITDNDGDYVVTVKITSGNYTTVKQQKFVLLEQDAE